MFLSCAYFFPPLINNQTYFQSSHLEKDTKLSSATYSHLLSLLQLLTDVNSLTFLSALHSQDNLHKFGKGGWNFANLWFRNHHSNARRELSLPGLLATHSYWICSSCRARCPVVPDKRRPAKAWRVLPWKTGSQRSIFARLWPGLSSFMFNAFNTWGREGCSRQAPTAVSWEESSQWTLISSRYNFDTYSGTVISYRFVFDYGTQLRISNNCRADLCREWCQIWPKW